MVITLSPSTPRAYEFACNSAACRPPGSGGTGGSLKSGGGSSKSGDHDRNQRGWAARKASPPSTPEGRRVVMNDLIARSRAQSAKNLKAAQERYGPKVTNTATPGTPYRNSGSIADQVARGQHLAKVNKIEQRNERIQAKLKPAFKADTASKSLKSTLDTQRRQTVAMIAKEKKARAELLKKAKKFAAGNDVEGLL